MTSSRSRLLLAAALLTGAVLAQAGQPAAEPSTASAAPDPLRPVQVSKPTPKPKPSTGPRNPGKKDKPGKVIYLTFDDGPQPEWTPKVLAVLARHDAKATFFMLGRETAPHPELVARVRQAGHTVGNHTYGHLILTKLSPTRLKSELMRGPKSKCFRPPFRATNAQVHKLAVALGHREILWDIDTSDWSKPGAHKIERAVLRGAHPGAIVLLHDGGGDRSQTVQALERILTKLSAKGYKFKALDC